MRKHDLQSTSDKLQSTPNILQPTPYNIRETFVYDNIGRNKDLVNFIKIIDSIDGSYSIALDSYWGSGKTFFVKQVKMILDANNEFTYDSVENKENVLEIWYSLLDKDKINTNYHIPIYYDAWSNDNDNDPILSIIYQIIRNVGNHATIEEQKGLGTAFSIAGDIFALVKGFNPLEIAKKLKSENPLEAIMQAKSLQEKIDEFIENLIPEHGERLLIIIDELDRCNPEFAVKLLERIKHYFNNDKVTFVFSVNIEELQHTIKQRYGANFNAHRYLDRFFDLTIKLPKPDMDKVFPNNSIIKNAIEKLNIQMREIPKYIRLCSRIDGFSVKDKVELCCDTEDIPEEGCITENTNTVIKNIVIPYLLALKITDNKEYEAFFNGQGAEKFRTFLTEAEDDIINYIESVFVEEENSINTQIDEFYRHIIRDYSLDETEEDYKCFGYSYQIGRCRISGYEKRYLTRIIDEILQSMENWKILEEENNGQT